MEVTQVLLEAGAHVASRAGDGLTAMHVASAYGRSEVVQVLLAHGAGSDQHNDDERTALHVASAAGHLNVVELLRHTENVNARDADGNTALHLALYHGHVEVATRLREMGADPQIANRAGRKPGETGMLDALGVSRNRSGRTVGWLGEQMSELNLSSDSEWLDSRSE